MTVRRCGLWALVTLGAAAIFYAVTLDSPWVGLPVGVLAVTLGVVGLLEDRPPAFTVGRYGPVVELREDGRWYRDGEPLGEADAADYDEVLGPAFRVGRSGR